MSDNLTWIKHDGGPMPVPGDTLIAYRVDSSDTNMDTGYRIAARELGISWEVVRQYAIVTPSPSAGVAIEDQNDAYGSDTVTSPSHYTSGGIECIDAIRAALTPEEFRGYCKGNMLKYAWRERGKNGDEDLRKAAVYAGFATEARS